MEIQDEVFDAELMGRQLKKLRNASKLSQERFAERLGMSRDTIYNYEKGKTAIDPYIYEETERLLQLEERHKSAQLSIFDLGLPGMERKNQKKKEKSQSFLMIFLNGKRIHLR